MQLRLRASNSGELWKEGLDLTVCRSPLCALTRSCASPGAVRSQASCKNRCRAG